MHSTNPIGRRQAIKGSGAGIAAFSAPSLFPNNTNAKDKHKSTYNEVYLKAQPGFSQ